MGDKKESETTDRQKGDEEERSSRMEESFSRCALTRWAILEFVHKGMAGANGRSKGQCFQ